MTIRCTELKVVLSALMAISAVIWQSDAPSTPSTHAELCRSQEQKICADLNDHCDFWARAGECSNNPAFMFHDCRLSCRVCKPDEPFGAKLFNPSNMEPVVFNAPTHGPRNNVHNNDRSSIQGANTLDQAVNQFSETFQTSGFLGEPTRLGEPQFNSVQNRLFPGPTGRIGMSRGQNPTTRHNGRNPPSPTVVTVTSSIHPTFNSGGPQRPIRPTLVDNDQRAPHQLPSSDFRFEPPTLHHISNHKNGQVSNQNNGPISNRRDGFDRNSAENFGGTAPNVHVIELQPNQNFAQALEEQGFQNPGFNGPNVRNENIDFSRENPSRFLVPAGRPTVPTDVQGNGFQHNQQNNQQRQFSSNEFQPNQNGGNGNNFDRNQQNQQQFQSQEQFSNNEQFDQNNQEQNLNNGPNNQQNSGRNPPTPNNQNGQNQEFQQNANNQNRENQEFRPLVRPDAGVQDFCARAMTNAPFNATDVVRDEGVFVTFEDVSQRATSSFDAMTDMIEKEGCTNPIVPPRDCRQSPCFTLMYRSMDGVCNNLRRPTWGSSFTPLIRNLPPKFEDGVNVPVSETNSRLPPAREVSQFLLRSTQNVVNDKFNALLMQWGQFISHDIVKTATHPHASCKTCSDDASRCMRIPVKIADIRATTFGCDNENAEPCCVKGPRTPPICGTGMNTPKEQMNQNTAFIDGSQIYGSSHEDAKKFRDGSSPFLKAEFFENQVFMPFNREDCPNIENCRAQFRAGDDRVNVFVGLAAVHNIFLREHARIADILMKINPVWDPERVFQETRKIIGAEMQIITYNEWLPKILGPHMYTKLIGPYRGYFPDTNPAVSAEVAGAAFRFGHGMITEFFSKIDHNGIEVGQVGFADGLLTSEKLLSTGEMELLLRGMILSPVKRPQRFADSTVNNLFGNQDLAALNIQRGREMGMPGYNEWRDFCGFKRAETIDDFADKMLDAAVIGNLKHFYQHPDDVDLFVGATLEDPLSDGLVGPTLACLLGKQFQRLRDGDRFWYENPGIFSPLQLEELRNTGLSKIFCDNMESFGTAPPDSFAFVNIKSFAACFQLPAINLEAWRTN